MAVWTPLHWCFVVVAAFVAPFTFALPDTIRIGKRRSSTVRLRVCTFSIHQHADLPSGPYFVRDVICIRLACWPCSNWGEWTEYFSVFLNTFQRTFCDFALLHESMRKIYTSVPFKCFVRFPYMFECCSFSFSSSRHRKYIVYHICPTRSIAIYRLNRRGSVLDVQFKCTDKFQSFFNWTTVEN